jgi:hypothetical protein
MRKLLSIFACLAITINSYPTFDEDYLPYLEVNLLEYYNNLNMNPIDNFKKICSEGKCHYTFNVNVRLDDGHLVYKGPVKAKVTTI